ncbi:MAG: hypothetical protein WAV72_25055 [Bradyrhizobium sp.]
MTLDARLRRRTRPTQSLPVRQARLLLQPGTVLQVILALRSVLPQQAGLTGAVGPVRIEQSRIASSLKDRRG